MSTQTQGGRGAALRGYRRRKAVLDLNEPPTEGRFDEGTSTQVAAPVVQASERPQSLRPTMIDVEALDDDVEALDDGVEALDDDVVESSARAFAEAKTNALRTGKRPLVVDLDSGRTNGLPQNNHNKRRRGLSSETVINCGLCINIDDSDSSRRSTAQLRAPTPAPAPPPPTEPIFCCPICMGPFAEATSTKCGHIFCLTCIKKALATAKSPTCPTCRKKVSKGGLIRVFLPSIS